MQKTSIVLAAALLASSAALDAQLFRRGAPVFKTFTSAELTIEYPERDWQQLPGAGTVLVTLATKRGDAAVVIERDKLGQPLTSADITDVFANIEADLVKERHPNAAIVSASLASHGTLGTIVRVEFTRPAAGGAERVRQFSTPAGWYIYRIVCSARSAEFAKHEAIFDRVIASAKITVTPPTGGLR
jgi:hypothetical protein